MRAGVPGKPRARSCRWPRRSWGRSWR